MRYEIADRHGLAYYRLATLAEAQSIIPTLPAGSYTVIDLKVSPLLTNPVVYTATVEK